MLNAYAEKQRVTGPSPLMKEMAAGFLAIKTTDLPGDLAAAVDSSKPGFAKLASLAAGFPDGMPADPQGMMAYSAAHPEMGAQLATVLLNLSKEMLTIHPMMEHLKKTAHKYGIEMRE